MDDVSPDWFASMKDSPASSASTGEDLAASSASSVKDSAASSASSVKDTVSGVAGPAAVPVSAGRVRAAPAGKVKASFNLLPSELDTCRGLAAQLGTTVTAVLQRAIRDEQFIQDRLSAGERFALVDKSGTPREIIWR